jgi:hypothetical protein
MHIYTGRPRDGRRTLGCWRKNVCGGQVPDRGSLPCRSMALCGVKDAGGDDSSQNSGVGMHSGEVNWARVNCTVQYGAGGQSRVSAVQRAGYIIDRDIVTVSVCDDGCGVWCGCFVRRMQGVFVYGRHRPALMISLAGARAQLPAQQSSPGQQLSRS